MSMLSRLATFGSTVSYSDITVVTSGSIIGNSAITFSPSLQQNDVVFLVIGDNDVDYTIPAGYVQITGNVITTVYKFSVLTEPVGACATWADTFI